MSSRIAADKVSRGPAPSDSLLDFVGNTPLLKLRRIAKACHPVEIFVTAEWFNPGGSVKDRPALNMIREGERSGALRPGKVILDAKGITEKIHLLTQAIARIEAQLSEDA